MNNKKGSTSIFLAFILTAMIALTAAFIYAAKQTAVFSSCDGLLTLAGKSLLSEFDLNLKASYGLFAFEANGSQMKSDILDYTDYSLHTLQSGRATPIENINVETGNYSLGVPAVLKKQILDYMKFAMAEQIFQSESDVKSEIEKEETGGKPPDAKRERTLRNQKVRNMLPSAALKGSGTGFVQWIKEQGSRLASIEEVFRESSQAYLINRYILEHFKYGLDNATGGPQERNTFFDHEVEYILEGNCSNKKNKEEVRKGLVLMRSSLNAAYLYLDSEKRAATLAAAELLTPGPMAAVTQAILTGTWALAEAENDVKLLGQGKPVNLFKSKSTWATDLNSVLTNKAQGCIDIGSREGLFYRDYLMIFLNLENEAIKLARVMDLMQINMKGIYNRDFLLSSCACGFYLKVQINGKERTYDFKY